MLSKIEFSVLRFIYDEVQRNGFVPNFREIANAINYSHETARQAVISLDRKGYVKRFPDKPRMITILRQPSEEMLAQ